jgi:hypothetical protein
MKKVKKYLIPGLIFISVFLVLIIPALSLAQTTTGTINQPTQPKSTTAALVPCNNTPDASGKVAQPCNFNSLITLVNNVINFILYFMVIPIAAIMFAYAGFLMVTAGGEAAHARTKAKDIFTKAVIGLVIAVAAWVIVKTILSILGWNGAWIGF